MKKFIAYLITAVLAFQLTAAAYDGVDNALSDTAKCVAETVKMPDVASVGGDWVIFGLARSNVRNDAYYSDYIKRVAEYIKSGKLSNAYPTDYARLTLALGAIGKDPTDIEGKNLIALLLDSDSVTEQGINGVIWALIALTSKEYEGADAAKDAYIENIAKAQRADGGWSFDPAAGEADPDLTGTALAALAPYREKSGVTEAVDKGIKYLSDIQTENGGFSSYGSESSESAAQVITALCALGIPLSDSRFVKNGHSVVDNLLMFYKPQKGFSHTVSDEANQMSTEQCLYALAAAWRAETGRNTLYDLSDSIMTNAPDSFGLSGKHADITYMTVSEEKTFSDIAGHKNQTAIEALASRYIISGMTAAEFMPDKTMTRAEFATITVNALGLPQKWDNPFNDVAETEWFCNYVSTAYAYGIVSGVSESEFNPNGTITREEAMAMVARAAALAGINTNIDADAARNALSIFDDYRTISDWAVSSAAVCVNEGIAQSDGMELKPKEYVLRAEIAEMLFRMMERAELI